MNRRGARWALAFIACALAGCAGGARDPYWGSGPQPGPGVTLLNVDAPQQSTLYTSGPAAARALLRFHGRDYDEFDIAHEMRIDDRSDTPPDRLAKWLENHAFAVTWGEHGSIDLLRKNLAAGIPTLVEWCDWGGHWAVVIGYDDRGTPDPGDDVIIFADPAGAKSGRPDGRTWMNAQRFDAMWFDARTFGKPVQRVFLTAVPGTPSR